MIGWTNDFGGNGGGPFAYENLSTELVGISGNFFVNAGTDTISQLSFTFRNAQGQQNVIGPFGNQAGSNPQSWRVPAGQHISKFHITFNAYVNSLQFQTNLGIKSPIWGKESSNVVDAVGSERRIRGVRGRSGWNLDQIAFLFE